MRPSSPPASLAAPPRRPHPLNEAPLTLTHEELTELTGYVQPSRQKEWLKRNLFKFRLDKRLRPKVDRQHYLARMSGSRSDDREAAGPDWSKLS